MKASEGRLLRKGGRRAVLAARSSGVQSVCRSDRAQRRGQMDEKAAIEGVDR